MNKFEKLLKKRKISIHQLAHKASISAANLYDIKNGKRKISNMTLETAVRLAKALNITAEELLELS